MARQCHTSKLLTEGTDSSRRLLNALKGVANEYGDFNVEGISMDLFTEVQKILFAVDSTLWFSSRAKQGVED